MVEHHPDIEADDFVFTVPQGAGPDDNRFRQRFSRPALERAGLADKAPTPHDLRHSLVAMLIEAGLHAKAIQARAQLDHGDFEHHLLPGMKRREARRPRLE